MQTPLKSARILQGKSIRQLALAAGTNGGNLSRIERGEQSASPDLAARLVKALGGAITEIQILYPERFVEQVQA